MNGVDLTNHLASTLQYAGTVAAVALLQAPLAITAWRLTGRWYRPASTAQQARDSFLAACAIWHLEVLLLAALHALHWGGVLVLHLLLLAAAGWMTRGGAGSLERASHASERDTPPRSSRAALWGAAGALGIIPIGFALYRIAANPDPYDSLTYHLMLPARWLDAESLEAVSTIFGDIAPTYVPFAVETFFFGLMIPTGFDGLARIGQLPFLLAGAHLMAELAAGGSWRDATVPSRVRGIAAAAMFMLLPELLVQGTGSMVDVAAVVLFLGALHRLVIWRESRLGRDALLAGALAGLLCASRFTGPMYLVALIPIAVASLGRQWLRGAACFVAALLVTGAYPYLRNWLWTGNPLYPLAVQIGEMKLCDGLFTASAMVSNRYHVADVATAASYLRAAWGYSGLAAAAGAVLIPLASFGKLAPSRFAAPALLLFALHFFLVPYNANMRFLFPCWALCVLSLFTMPAMLKASPCVHAGIASAFALEALLRLREQFRHLDPAPQAAFILLFTVILALMGAAAAWAALRIAPRVRVAIGMATVVVAVGVFAGLSEYRDCLQEAIDARDVRFRGFAAGWEAIRQLPAGRRIAYAGMNLPYPLRGGACRHDVFTIPLDGSPARSLPHEQAQSARTPVTPSASTVEITLERNSPNHAQWLERLFAENVEYLALYVVPGRHDLVPELRWAESDSAHFEPLAPEAARAGPRIALFRVKNGRANLGK